MAHVRIRFSRRMLLRDETITIHGLPQPAPRPPFPLLTVAVPPAIAVALWVLTSSPGVLLFAVWGPVLGIGGLWEARRAARRTRRLAVAECRRRMAAYEAQITARADAIRAELLTEASSGGGGGGTAGSTPPVLFLGRADIPSRLTLRVDGEADDPELVPILERLEVVAATIADAPVLVRDGGEIVVRGSESLCRSFARALVLHVLVRTSYRHGEVTVPPGESWVDGLPHRIHHADFWEVRQGGVRILRVAAEPESSSARPVVVGFDGEPDAEPRVESTALIRGLRPVLASVPQARVVAEQLAEQARREGWRSLGELPKSVALAELLPAQGDSGAGLGAAIGLSEEGVLRVDLDVDGPHALIAGTTGSGKSELLISWVLALAAARPPEELGFLLIDFKGGAAFAPLTGVPHVVGVVSDLDSAGAERAVASLRAELRRRERELALRGARSVRDLAPGQLPRLVVVVDEFAALLSELPELQSVFADLAARGRSLGIHLILCTQRPAGVVREGVLANIPLRLCLRVMDRADSEAIVGSAEAVQLPAGAYGRALVRTADGIRTVQLALSDRLDASRVSQRWEGHGLTGARPWCDPLPAVLPAHALSPGPEGVCVGLVDRPHEQRQDPLSVDPWRRGLLVLGAGGSGRTTALAMLASASDAELRWVPEDPAELWEALQRPSEARVLVLADDLDRTLALSPPEERAELSELVVRALGDAARTGIALAASARSTAGAMHTVQAAFEDRILLRLASRDEHLLAGGELRSYRSTRGPGSGLWRGHEMQFAIPESSTPEAWQAPVEVLRLSERELSVATPRPGELRERLLSAGCSSSGLRIDDPESWLADYTALAELRRGGSMLVIGCTGADHRALTRSRSPLPPLGKADEAWLVSGGTTRRVRFVLS